MREYGRDYMSELAKEQPDLVDLLIVTMDLPENRRSEILTQLTNKIKESFVM